MQRFISNALNGALATIPMSAMMYLGKKSLPWWQRIPLPPRLITKNVLTRFGLNRLAWGASEKMLSLAAHFAYGTGVGAFFGTIPGSLGRFSLIFRGTSYGLLIWTVSYLGIIPYLGLLPRATKAPLQRNVLMILAHLIWGASLGQLVYWQSRSRILRRIEASE